MRRIGLWALLCFACSPEPMAPSDPDAGVMLMDGGVAVFVPPVIAEPEPARIDQLQLPVMTPCPNGWRTVAPSESGLLAEYCEPFPNGSATICAADESQLPGTEGCARIGSACGADPWAVDLPNDRTVWFVLAGAAGGSGTRAAPFGTIAAAISAASDGDVIAVAKGTYDEALVLDRAVELHGACVAETELTDSGGAGTVRATGGGASLRNVRVSGFDVGITVLGSLSLEDVVIGGAAAAAILIDGGALTGARVVMRETEDGNYFGRGLVALNGARAELSSVEIFGNRESGVFASGAGTDVKLSDVTIRDTLGSEATDEYGVGALSLEGARLELNRAALERNRTRSLWAYGGTIVCRDCVVRDTRSESSTREDGLGADAQGVGHLIFERVLIQRSRTLGVYLSDEGGSASLTDVIIDDVEVESVSGAGGRGINAQLGVDLQLVRVVVKDTHEMGVFIAAQTTATLTDVIIDGVASVGILGTGLTVTLDATTTAERVLVARTTQGGIAIAEDSEVTLTDVAVEDCIGLEVDGSEGLGLVVQTRAQLTATRLRIERCRDQGVFLRDPGTRAVIEDLIVRDIATDGVSGRFGRGVAAEVGAEIVIRRGLIEAAHEHALMVNAGGASLIADDLRVMHTLARDSDGISGRALAVQVDGHAEITRGHFSDSVEVGVFVSGEAATATLTQVIIERTESRSDGVGGRGIDVGFGGRVVAHGLLLADNREFGVVAVNDGSRVMLFDTVVTGTRENACPAEMCLGFGKGGTGVGAAKNASIRMERFLVEKSALAGLALTRGGTIDLFDGEVAFNPVGVNVDADGYDLDRLRDQVRYHDNDLTLQSISLPEPRASDVLAGATD